MSNAKIQESEYNNILNLYNDGTTAPEIAKMYDVSSHVIYSILHKFPNRRKKKSYKNFSNEEKENIVKLYLEGKSTVEIGKMYKFDHHSIASVLDEYNIDRRDASHCNRTYSVNEEYFDNIDTQNKAYFLGFLFADGNNCMQKSTIRIALQEKDRDILEKLRIDIGSNKPLCLKSSEHKRNNGEGYDYKDQYALDVCNKHWCERLSELGCVPNKSLVLKFPDYLSDEMLPHFIRGYFDGDGCIVNAKSGNHNINLTSTKDFCISVQNIVFNLFGIKSYIRSASNKNGITSVWTLSKKQDIKTFLDWIYKDAELYLKRKYDRYLEKYC